MFWMLLSLRLVCCIAMSLNLWNSDLLYRQRRFLHKQVGSRFVLIIMSLWLGSYRVRVGLRTAMQDVLRCWFGNLWILRVAYSETRSYLYWPRDGYKSFKCLQTFLITQKCLMFSRVAYRFVWSVTPLSHTVSLWSMKHTLLSTVEHWPKFYGLCSTIFCKLEKFVLLHH